MTRPSSSPDSFAGNRRAMVRPTNARNTCVAWTNGLGELPDPPERVRLELDRYPLVMQGI